MLKKFLYTAAIVVFTFGSVQSLAAPVDVLAPIELTSNFQYPNGITRASNGTLYIGSVTSGQILRINPQGKIETFFAGNDEVFAANALRLDERRGILWGTSSDFLGVRTLNGETIRRPHRIFAIDTRTGKILRVILMPDSGFGNDIALDEDGGVYVTDSSRPRIHYLAPGATQLQIWAEDKRFASKEIGLAGIARKSDGTTIVGLFSAGEILKVIPQPQGGVKVEPILLVRKLENPDGMQFASDGRLLVIEGAINSGNGSLLRIDVLSPGTQPKSIETLARGMESPVNLTVSDREIWVTEARIRHRLLPGQEKQIPDRFFIRRFTLPR
ncbi:gluconolaconase [Chlorogloeopsis sp. ULAP01]|uniref:Vgb family protein n=1 Tax=Chlorogloeopsis sp. ULAP01 TaxID=3056483 RepID=UPI0025AA63A8|nr:gluconolaconase [Chlorogloeopsis sp. ULAP01]MDM9385205.1 gluconolaconase [Chlorogloeopsis sp. ULAP01]